MSGHFLSLCGWADSLSGCLNSLSDGLEEVTRKFIISSNLVVGGWKINFNVVHFQLFLYGNTEFIFSNICKVITKSKVGSLTMQPAKHDVTGMPLYQMYPYPIRSSTLWLAIIEELFSKVT